MTAEEGKMLTTDTTNIAANIAGVVQRDAEAARLTAAILEQYAEWIAAVRWPRTFADHFELVHHYNVTTWWYSLGFRAKTGHEAVFMYGTVKKLCDALVEAGWEAAKGLELEAGDGLTAAVSVRRAHEGRSWQLDLDFTRMPEGPYCRLVQEVVEVPATMKRVMRVVCEEHPARDREGEVKQALTEAKAALIPGREIPE